jgi:hypothetical protein
LLIQLKQSISPNTGYLDMVFLGRELSVELRKVNTLVHKENQFFSKAMHLAASVTISFELQ